MKTVLEEIIESKVAWLTQQKIKKPLDGFIDTLIPSDRDFLKALSKSPAKFILECKKASPSKGLIRADFDLDAIADIYAKHAAVVSVLTDEKYFQGQLDFIPRVRARVPCPVLCKDFIIDPYQVYLARHYQADAILLMLSVLSDEQYCLLADLARKLHLGILTEISNQSELNRAIHLKAEVVGINNRDLRDLSIDLNRTKTLAPLLPKTTCIISESGINTHQDIRTLAPFVNGFLIGSALMAQAQLDQAVKRMIYGDNKICGLTREEDAKVAYDAGANYGGLIFVKKSPRFVTLDRARNIMTAAPLSYVGVFQNNDIQEIIMLVRSLGLSVVQLHGEESQKDIETLRNALPKNTQIWKAQSIVDETPSLNPNVDRNLLDSRIGAQSGGTGHPFNWSLIPLEHAEKLMIAGGLSSENAQKAAQLGCAGLDFNSGVESAPGIKDKMKINAAFSALREY